jgi:GAF domain/ANTAR domain
VVAVPQAELMAGDRLAKVLAAIVDFGDDTGSVVDHLCSAAVRLLGLTGAGLSLMVDGQLRETAGASDPHIAVLQELQLTLGEGPCLDAGRSGAPVLEPDLGAPQLHRWPAFGPAAADAGLQAVFAFPLRVGVIGIGALTLYRDRPGQLSADELAYGLVLADVSTQIILILQAGAPPDTLHELLAEQPAHWAEVHQATGMISVQLRTPLDQAFLRLRAQAFSSGRPLREVAHEIVHGRLRLGD